MPRVFFAEHTYRATRYASRDYAGGEAARSLRYSFSELDLYFSADDYRKKNESKLIRQAQLQGQEPALPSSEDYANALNALHALKDLRNRASNLWNAHTHGVIYAVHFDGTGIEHLVRKGQFGIESTRAIPLNKIAAKTRIPIDFSIEKYSDPFIFNLPIWNGLLKHLRRESSPGEFHP